MSNTFMLAHYGSLFDEQNKSEHVFLCATIIRQCMCMYMCSCVLHNGNLSSCCVDDMLNVNINYLPSAAVVRLVAMSFHF